MDNKKPLTQIQKQWSVLVPLITTGAIPAVLLLYSLLVKGNLELRYLALVVLFATFPAIMSITYFRPVIPVRLGAQLAVINGAVIAIALIISEKTYAAMLGWPLSDITTFVRLSMTRDMRYAEWIYALITIALGTLLYFIVGYVTAVAYQRITERDQ